MSWSELDTLTAEDGRQFQIHSEHVRGEGRWYWAVEVGRTAGDSPHSPHLPFDGAYDKRTVKRRVERYVRETSE